MGEIGVGHAVTLSRPGDSSDETLMMMISSLRFQGRWHRIISNRRRLTFRGVSGEEYDRSALKQSFEDVFTKEVPELG